MERRDRLTETLGQLARRGIVGLVRSTTIGEPITTLTRARRGSRVPGRRTASAPMIATGQERRAGREREARGTALPRPVRRPEHRSLREDRDGRGLLERVRGRGDRADVAAAAIDRDPAERSSAQPTTPFRHSSRFARKRSGRSSAAPRKKTSESESWFATTITFPGGTRAAPSTSSLQTARIGGPRTARTTR